MSLKLVENLSDGRLLVSHQGLEVVVVAPDYQEVREKAEALGYGREVPLVVGHSDSLPKGEPRKIADSKTYEEYILEAALPFVENIGQYCSFERPPMVNLKLYCLHPKPEEKGFEAIGEVRIYSVRTYVPVELRGNKWGLKGEIVAVKGDILGIALVRVYRPSGFWDYTWEILSDAKVLEPAPSLEAVVKLVQRFLKESEDQLEPGNRYKIITYTPARALEMHLIRPLLTPSELARAEHGFFFEATWGNPTPKAEADLFPLKKRD